MKLNGKSVDLVQLGAEMRLAGVLTGYLGVTDDVLHTYDENGAPIPLAETATPVVKAHTDNPPPPSPTARQRLLKALAGATTIAALKSALVDYFTSEGG